MLPKNVHSLKIRCSYVPHILLEKRPFSQKHGAKKNHAIPPAFMPIFGQKNVNSVKITLFYGPKK